MISCLFKRVALGWVYWGSNPVFSFSISGLIIQDYNGNGPYRFSIIIYNFEHQQQNESYLLTTWWCGHQRPILITLYIVLTRKLVLMGLNYRYHRNLWIEQFTKIAPIVTVGCYKFYIINSWELRVLRLTSQPSIVLEFHLNSDSRRLVLFFTL